MIAPDVLARHMARQRWYPAAEEPSDVRVVQEWTERADWPQLIRLLVECELGCFQLVLGLRPASHPQDFLFLEGHDEAVLRDVEVGSDPVVAYDAVHDPELARAMLDQVVPGREARRTRVMGGEQSNTSLVYDEEVILKVFRRLHRGANPEIEVTGALAGAGFPWVAAPLGSLRREDLDLAVAQPFLAGGVEGWALAQTSLRDLFGVHDTQSVPIVSFDSPPPSADPGQAGGDFSADARRLGETTAGMHGALADAFGRRPGDARTWADSIAGQVGRVELPAEVSRAAEGVLADLRRADAGPEIRVHGDLHLGQVMRTDAGWYVLDFEGEPARAFEERCRPSSALRDVAGMLRSFGYAAAVATLDRDAQAREVGDSWEERNRRAFLRGYLPEAEKAGVLPGDEASVDAVMAAFELEKAIYELGYERAYRPQWEGIPMAALTRMADR